MWRNAAEEILLQFAAETKNVHKAPPIRDLWKFFKVASHKLDFLRYEDVYNLKGK